MPDNRWTRLIAPFFEVELRHLPEYGRLLFDHLYSEYAPVLDALSEAERRAIAALKTLRDQDQLMWKDIYSFEQIVFPHLSIEQLRRKIKTLRTQFRNIAGNKEFEIYLASKPPDLDTETSVERLKRDGEFLLNEFYFRYTVMSSREHMRNNLLKIVAVMAAGAIIIGSIATVFNYSSGWGKGVTTLSVVMFAGIVGALASMQQRIQSAASEGDPLYLFSMLTHGWFGIFLSPISGAIFSIILYLMFTGGFLTGSLFPRIVSVGGVAAAASPSPTPTPNITNTPSPTPSVSPKASPSASPSASTSASVAPSLTATNSPSPSPTTTATPTASPKATPSEPVELNKFLTDTGPVSGMDYALLVIWAFIAGFAERFVPDALNRLISRNDGEKAK